MPSNEECKEIHKEMLVLLKKFHRICVENQINYSLHAGTLLGAIRERGFIPWDDDIDVTMNRSEFKKFEKIVETCIDKDKEVEYVSSFVVPRLILRRAGRPVVWLDIFIYDYISQNKLCQKMKLYILMFVKAFLRTKTTMKTSKASQKYKGWKYFIIFLFYQIGRPFPYDKKLQLLNRIEEKWLCGNKTMAHRANDQWIGLKPILPVSLLHDYIEVPFEDTKMMILKHYHEVLVPLYGEDYMVPKRMAATQSVTHSLCREAL